MNKTNQNYDIEELSIHCIAYTHCCWMPYLLWLKFRTSVCNVGRRSAMLSLDTAWVHHKDIMPPAEGKNTVPVLQPYLGKSEPLLLWLTLD